MLASDASLDEWQAVLDQLLVRDGRIAEARYLTPFDLLFGGPEFEYAHLVERRGFEPLTSAVRGQRSPS